MSKKYIVNGRIRIDYHFKETVEASTEKYAVKKAEKIVYERLGVHPEDVISDEIYCDRVKDWGGK